jgi:hypothetical protein
VRQAGYEGDTPWFDGITIDCRTVAVISRWGMAWGWQGEDAAENAAYASSDALRLGQNLIAYATATRAWARQAAARVQFPAEEWPSAGALSMVQVIYDGEWKTRAKGPSILLQTFNRKTDVPVKFNLRQLRLSSPDLFDSPLLYLTGHEGFHIEPDEATRLREYLLNGGSLLAEACCGRKAFGRAFEAEMARLLPEFPLLPIPSDAGLFKLPNPIQTLHVTPALAAVAGRDSVAPPLKVATLNGRYAVIYSPYGMAGGWEMSQSPYALGYSDDSAIRLGQNILLCAITQ